MGYIMRPPPPDSEVIFPASADSPAFTWGDHRQMEAMLEELESDSHAVFAARKRLDEALEKIGWAEKSQQMICQWCWKTEASGLHEPECRDYDDPTQHVVREAGGYQYFDEDFVLIHTTSVPMTDEEALEYFGAVAAFIIDRAPRYIARREMNGSKHTMMPFRYNYEENEYEPIPRRDS